MSILIGTLATRVRSGMPPKPTLTTVRRSDDKHKYARLFSQCLWFERKHTNGHCTTPRSLHRTTVTANAPLMRRHHAASISGAIPNFEAGIPYNLPLPNGTGASPYPGGLPNIAHVMQSSGYATAHFGKWHLGGLNPEWYVRWK